MQNNPRRSRAGFLAWDEASLTSEESIANQLPYIDYLEFTLYPGDGPPKNLRGRDLPREDFEGDLRERSTPAQTWPNKEPTKKTTRGNKGLQLHKGT